MGTFLFLYIRWTLNIVVFLVSTCPPPLVSLYVCVLVACHVTVVHSGPPFMHVITNRPVGPLRHSAFLPELRLHFHPAHSPPIISVPPSPFSSSPLLPATCFPSDSVSLCLPIRALCLSCVPPLLNLGGEREEMAHYFKDTVVLAANPWFHNNPPLLYSPSLSSPPLHLPPDDPHPPPHSFPLSLVPVSRKTRLHFAEGAPSSTVYCSPSWPTNISVCQ